MSVSLGQTGLSNGPQAVGLRLTLAEGPLGLAWHHCSTTAEFLGEFYALRPGVDAGQASETRHGVGYLTNELLENAVKFRSRGDVVVETSVEGPRFELKVTNRIGTEIAERFQGLLAEITTREPGDLLIERIEANAADPSSNGSGLGLLTLMSDYGARLGWTFGDGPERAPVELETYAALDLY